LAAGTIFQISSNNFNATRLGKPVAKMENERIVETGVRARGAERGPTVRNVLVIGTGLVVAGFIIVYIVYFGG
jgi:hypothetical protein